MDRAWLKSEIDLDGISPDKAFNILGNEIRLDIIRVLWEADALYKYDDVDNTINKSISFSDLRRRVGVEDNGQFNYHLSKLIPYFVQKTNGGYHLTNAGKRVARTVVTVSGKRDRNISNKLDTDCPLCGSKIKVTYEDQWLRFICTECEGLFGDVSPDGTILNANFPKAGLTNRTPEEALSTGLYRCMLDLTYLVRGICCECASPVTMSVSVCENHSIEEELCKNCGTPFEVWIETQCKTCKFSKRLPFEIYITALTPIMTFLYNNGVNVLSPSFDRLVDAIQNRFKTSVMKNPLRITINIEGEENELSLKFDDQMNIINIYN